MSHTHNDSNKLCHIGKSLDKILEDKELFSDTRNFLKEIEECCSGFLSKHHQIELHKILLRIDLVLLERKRKESCSNASTNGL